MSTVQESQSESAAQQGGARPSLRQRVGLWLGPALFLAILFFTDLDPERRSVTAMAAIAVLMATWWVTEAIPIPATALVPIVFFPLMGIMRGDSRSIGRGILVDESALPSSVMIQNVDVLNIGVAKEYVSWLIFLFLGGFLIAIAVERWGLHKRIALNVLRLIGGQPHRLVLGFMVATAFLSMWLSNTATTMMMMPMALSLIVLYEDLNRKRVSEGATLDPRVGNFPLVLMLGLAHSASIGGLATLIGTPPNGVLVDQVAKIFPEAPPISFAAWMVFALPFSIVFLFIAWALLTRVIFPLPADSPFSGKKFIQDELKRLGPITNEEIKVASVFAGVALLWMTRKDIAFGVGPDAFRVRGWSHWLDRAAEKFDFTPVGPLIDDGTIAIAMALLLFIIPASKAKGGVRLMDWESAKKVPWGILLLFGGGLALARGFGVSGLSGWIGNRFEVLEGAPPVMMVAAVATAVAGLTELTSNTATATMSMPITASLAQAIQVHPLLLMIPAALAASCAFVLPVSTPPNAIVYGSERVPIVQMIKAGLIMEVVALVLLTITVFTLGAVTFGLLGEFPAWAVPVP